MTFNIAGNSPREREVGWQKIQPNTKATLQSYELYWAGIELSWVTAGTEQWAKCAVMLLSCVNTGMNVTQYSWYIQGIVASDCTIVRLAFIYVLL